MRGRWVWALLLLAAVFAMHGLQCAAADSGTSSGLHGAVHAVAGTDPVLHLVGSSTGMTAPESVSAALGATLAAAAVVGPSLGVDHDSSPHDSGHLWAVCLAILAAGLAAMLLALAGRLPDFRLPHPRRATGGPWAWLGPPRPPDLYSLCLMRI